MPKYWKIVLAVVAALITIIGLITGKFLFIAVWLPLGFLFKKNDGDVE